MLSSRGYEGKMLLAEILWDKQDSKLPPQGFLQALDISTCA